MFSLSKCMCNEPPLNLNGRTNQKPHKYDRSFNSDLIVQSFFAGQSWVAHNTMISNTILLWRPTIGCRLIILSFGLQTIVYQTTATFGNLPHLWHFARCLISSLIWKFCINKENAHFFFWNWFLQFPRLKTVVVDLNLEQTGYI